jgi:Transport and Golgi organisation 2
MNRDEKLARPRGLPPAFREVEGRRVLCPSEPGGGTWIAINDSGVTLSLINWYSVPGKVETSAITRGVLVNSTITADAPAHVEAVLANLPLRRINPFRLIGIFPGAGKITEWRWDLKWLERIERRWRAQQWISSGFDEPAAQRERDRTFQRALKQNSAGSLDWLRRLHRSHAPQEGPFSTCMHRADAATVSYTEVVVMGNKAMLRYCRGSPCLHQPWF